MLYQNSCENKILPLSLLLPLIKRLVKNVDFLPRVFSSIDRIHSLVRMISKFIFFPFLFDAIKTAQEGKG